MCLLGVPGGPRNPPGYVIRTCVEMAGMGGALLLAAGFIINVQSIQ